MKKLKLLTSLSALVLVLSLGACSEPTDETPSEQDEPTSSETTPEEPEPVVLSNYTLSITLKDTDGNPVVIPFYDTVYLCGDWDNWTAFTALTDAGDESGSVLTTTLDTISEGTHEFKGLIGNQDDTPSWDLTEFIVNGTGNATFEVAATEGDNATKNLEFTVDATKIPVLEETPMTEEEIITAILAAAEDADDNGLGWVAFHGEALDESTDDLTEAYLTTDVNGDPYGYVYEYDTDEEAVLFEYYYVDGMEYFHGLTYDNYSVDEAEDSFEDMLEDYIEGLTPFAYASYGDRVDWELGHEEGSSIYTLTIPDTYVETLTVRRAGDDFEIIAVEESTEDVINGVESTKGELITAADVETQMGGYNKWNWADAQNPAELIENIHESGCYTLEIEYDIYIASEGTTYGDYSTGNYDLNALEETLEVSSSYICDFYITEDAVLFEEYIYYDLGFYAFYSLVYSELIVNDYDSDYGNVMWDFVLDNSYNWALDGLYYGHWQDTFYSLFDEGTEGCFSTDSFTYYGSGTYEGVPCTAWTNSDARGLFLLLGTDWLFSNPSTATIGSYAGYTYFFEGLQEMLITYGYYGFTYYEYPTQCTDLVYLQEVYFYADIYDVGTTDIDDEIASAFAGLY